MQRILYIEDEADDVFFMTEAFKRAGIGLPLMSLADGQQAISYLAGDGAFADRTRHPLPQLILLDLNLPLVSGFDVLKWARSRPETAAIPVVIFSSSGRKEDRAKAQEYGANAYLQKPPSGMDFVEVARQLRDQWLTQT